jgi:hypothetical protein
MRKRSAVRVQLPGGWAAARRLGWSLWVRPEDVHAAAVHAAAILDAVSADLEFARRAEAPRVRGERLSSKSGRRGSNPRPQAWKANQEGM